MSEPTNVYAAPTQGEDRMCDLPEEAEIQARHPVPPSWELVVTGEAVFVAERRAGAGYRFTREELAQNATLVTATGSGVLITIPLDKRRTLAFPRTAADAMDAWLGAQLPVLVRRSVQRAWGWNVGLGLVFVLTTDYQRMNMMDMGWLTLGLGMVACGVLARARPAAWIWWLDGTLFGLMTALIAVDVLGSHRSYWRLAFAAFLVWGAVGRFRLASHVSEGLRRLASTTPS